eukprot:Skav234218  [mRNA]  locus=scaffold1464:12514:14806:- [translate_table: standard]
MVNSASAKVFIFSGASAQPTSWDKEDKEDKDKEASAKKDAKSSAQMTKGQSKQQDVRKANDAAKEPASEPNGKSTAEVRRWAWDGLGDKDELLRRNAKFRQGLANLPPESKKALQEWVKMTESSTWTLLGLNCLLLVFVLGMLTLGAAAIVGFFQINIFNMDVWREGISTFQTEGVEGLWSRAVRPAPRAREILHDRRVDLAEL